LSLGLAVLCLGTGMLFFVNSASLLSGAMIASALGSGILGPQIIALLAACRRENLEYATGCNAL